MALNLVRISLRGMSVFERRMRRNDPAMRKVTKQWGALYRSFAQRRFVRFSRGGGDWPALKAATKRRRRGNSGFAILRDTGTLFGALSPGFADAPGKFTQDLPFGVRVGYGGVSRHPKGRASVADIASFHNSGAGNLPKRQIIAMPDDATVEQMRAVMRRAIKGAADGSHTT